MNNFDKLHISFGLIKNASPRWAKVLAAIPDETAKISWLRNFIPKNVGRYSVNPTELFGLPDTYKIFANDLARGIMRPESSSASLLDKFKTLHRYVLKNKQVQQPYPVKPVRYKIDKGNNSWVRAYNNIFKSEKIGPNDLVPFSHGGGLSHINKFLKGKGGYNTDSGYHGIMMTPHSLTSPRDPFYASRRISKIFDTPARLSGYIPAKYLKNSMNTGYETSLPSKYFNKIVNPKVEQLDATSSINSDVYGFLNERATRALVDWEKFKERVSRANSLDSFNIISKL